ncbi:MAG: hypothetical protein WA579_15430, partial [Rhodomicrobium sp.]
MALRLVLILVTARPAIAAHRNAAVAILFEAAIMLGVAAAAAAVIALVALLVTALRLVSAEAMIVLGIGYTPTPVIPTAAGFIEAV